MLESQRKTSQQRQNQNGFGVPLGLNLGTSVNLVSSRLPQTPNGCCGSTGIGVHEISGSDGSGQVATLRKVSALVLGGKERSVATWRNRSPGRVLFGTNVKGQRPAGIDSADGIDWNLKGSKDINEQNLALTDFNTGSVKHGPNHKNHQARWSQAQGKAPEAGFGKARSKSEQHDGGNYPGDCLTESGSKDLHIANDSLAPGVFA